MKAKHVAARIGSTSVWTKVFCAIIAVCLLMLMIPNGLRANATTSVVEQSNGNVDLQQGEVKTQTEQETLNDFKAKFAEAQNQSYGEAGWWTLNSDVTFVPSSYNSAETAGHFVTQKAFMPFTEYYKYIGGGGHLDTLNDLKAALEEFQIWKSHGTMWPEGMLDNLVEEETYGNVFEDLSEALIILDDETRNLSKPRDLTFNEFRIGVDKTFSTENSLVGFEENGTISYMYVTLGEGSNPIDIIKNTNVYATRIIPTIPPAERNPKFSDPKGLLGDRLNDANNVQAYFLNWGISLDGVNYIPITWVLDMVESNSLPILPYTHYFFKANFWDVEDMVPVHLDFSGAYVDYDLDSALRSEGWYTTDFINGSIWTKAYFDWMPTWYVYSDIFDNFGKYIFGSDTDGVCVYKDEMIKYLYEEVDIKHDFYPFAGPHMFKCDNENWSGTLDKETTFSFSVYPVTPRGHVMHATYNGIFNEVTDYVDHAFVMFYNEWGFPLFNYKDAQYNPPTFFIQPNLYSFFNRDVKPEPGVEGRYEYCYDTQIDHAVVYAWSDTPGITYLPLWVDINNFNAMASGLMDDGLLDFQVERMMYADLNTFMSQDSISSIEVSYFQDGVQLFDTYTATNPWEMAMLSVPMVTNGTITTGDNRLVTGFASNIDFVRPFGEVDMLNAFDANNFEASGTSHWYQCQIKVNPKPGYTFNTWTYDYMPISADTYKGEAEIVISEPMFLPNHTIGMQFNKSAGAEADNAAIYGDAAGTAIYGNAAEANVILASDGAATADTTGTAQTGDSAGFAFAILALLTIAGAGVLAGRKLYEK